MTHRTTPVEPGPFVADGTDLVDIDIELANAIDHMLCPAEGAMALAELRTRLPDLHRPYPRSRRLARLGAAPLYHGEIVWADVAFAYVRARGRFVVVDAWPASVRPRPRLDCILTGDGPEMVPSPRPDLDGGLASHADDVFA